MLRCSILLGQMHYRNTLGEQSAVEGFIPTWKAFPSTLYQIIVRKLNTQTVPRRFGRRLTERAINLFVNRPCRDGNGSGYTVTCKANKTTSRPTAIVPNLIHHLSRRPCANPTPLGPKHCNEIFGGQLRGGMGTVQNAGDQIPFGIVQS